MSEFRFNRVTGDWVIIATEAARRPEDYIIRMNRRDMPPHVSTCPFCVGNEETTEQLFSDPDGGDCALRVVRNKLHALQPDVPYDVAVALIDGHMFFTGLHE